MTATTTKMLGYIIPSMEQFRYYRQIEKERKQRQRQRQQQQQQRQRQQQQQQQIIVDISSSEKCAPSSDVILIESQSQHGGNNKTPQGPSCDNDDNEETFSHGSSPNLLEDLEREINIVDIDLGNANNNNNNSDDDNDDDSCASEDTILSVTQATRPQQQQQQKVREVDNSTFHGNNYESLRNPQEGTEFCRGGDVPFKKYKDHNTSTSSLSSTTPSTPIVLIHSNGNNNNNNNNKRRRLERQKQQQQQQPPPSKNEDQIRSPYSVGSLSPTSSPLSNFHGNDTKNPPKTKPWFQKAKKRKLLQKKLTFGKL